MTPPTDTEFVRDLLICYWHVHFCPDKITFQQVSFCILLFILKCTPWPVTMTLTWSNHRISKSSHFRIATRKGPCKSTWKSLPDRQDPVANGMFGALGQVVPESLGRQCECFWLCICRRRQWFCIVVAPRFRQELVPFCVSSTFVQLAHLERKHLLSSTYLVLII